MRSPGIIEDRYEKRSTIVTSQVPIDHWYDMIGNPTIADTILVGILAGMKSEWVRLGINGRHSAECA